MVDRPFSGAAADPVSLLARIGRRIRWLLILYCLVILVLALATLLWPDRLIFHPSSIWLAESPSGDLAGRVVALAIEGIPLVPIAFVIWHALKLCRAMAARQLFTVEAPRRLRAIGIALLISALLRPLTGALIAAGVTHDTPVRMAFALSADDFGIAIVGAVLIAVAAAAQEAVRLADENSRFV